MKKNVMLISTLALAVMSGSAMAGINGGAVEFSGVVANTTCDIGLVSNGSQSNVIQLGSVGTGASSNQSSPVSFTLQPSTTCTVTPAGGSTANPQTQANISFTGNFDSMGLKPTSGSATDARMLLTAVNSTTANTQITKSSNSAAFTLDNLNSGAQFNAVLQSGKIPGDYHSSLVYAVTYK